MVNYVTPPCTYRKTNYLYVSVWCNCNDFIPLFLVVQNEMKLLQMDLEIKRSLMKDQEVGLILVAKILVKQESFIFNFLKTLLRTWLIFIMQ